MTDRDSVVYVVPDKMGGMMNIIANLIEHRQADGLTHHAVLTHNRLQPDTRYGGTLAADTQATVEYSLPVENLRTVMRRLVRAIPSGEGVYVAGDLLDLATASVYDFGRAVIYMLHGDVEYYYDLAVKHDAIVHAFIAYSRRMYDELLVRLPHRASSIFHLPYGIPLPRTIRRPAAGPLRLAYVGRIDHAQKGVFDLPEIDRGLRAQGVPARWTIAGTGPDELELKRRWSFSPDVRWLGVVAPAAVPSVYESADVFVFPTRFEGFPVALLEAMAAGVVPVVSDIPSGVPEVVSDGVTGERAPIGDVRAFVAAIADLDRNRSRLNGMGAAARETIAGRFDIRDRVADYQALYVRWRELYRPRAASRHLQFGSRLDRPWLPNRIVSAVRSARRRRS